MMEAPEPPTYPLELTLSELAGLKALCQGHKHRALAYKLQLVIDRAILEMRK